MLPFSNATLTAVGSAEFTAEGARDEEDAPRWAGALPAYYQERRSRDRQGDDQNVRVRRSLIVDAADDDTIGGFEEGDTVAFTFADTALVGTVGAVEKRRLDGHPLQTTRVTLREE